MCQLVQHNSIPSAQPHSNNDAPQIFGLQISSITLCSLSLWNFCVSCMHVPPPTTPISIPNQLQASSLYTTNSVSDAVCQSHFNDMVAAKSAIIITVKVCQLLAVINRSTLTVMQTPTCHSLTTVTTAHVQDCKYCKQMEELCFHH